MMFPVVRTNGRNLFGELSRDMDRLFRETVAPAATAMPVDIREEGDVLVLELDVPGATQEWLDITVENGTLSIAVKPQANAEEQQDKYLVRERRVGHMARSFQLPDTADLDKIEARLTHGVLTLRVPKKEEAKPRQIPVK